MSARSYYNENDPYAAQWLRNLIDAGHIASGDVDERSIADVRADDLKGYIQCHFFAGIGGWSLALRLAGWPDDRSVWTGSCPCQPFSAAGAGKAADDERHLWPRWLPLIAECRPATVFGEQVEAAIGWGWLDAVFADLETEGYACGASVLPACGVGAPHIRQRLWFVADRIGSGLERCDTRAVGHERASTERGSETGELADAGRFGGKPDRYDVAAAPSGSRSEAREQRFRDDARAERATGELADARHEQAGRTTRPGEAQSGRAREPRTTPWSDPDWLPCTDEKARPVEPGTFPLAHGIPNRVGRLRAYGNAIVPQVAAGFIAAYCECRP